MDITLEPYAHLNKKEIIAPINKEYTFLGRMDKKKGLKVFYMTNDGEVFESKDVIRTAVLKVDVESKRKDGVAAQNIIKYKPGYYTQKLNVKNAIKYFKRKQATGEVVVTGEIREKRHN